LKYLVQGPSRTATRLHRNKFLTLGLKSVLHSLVSKTNAHFNYNFINDNSSFVLDTLIDILQLKTRCSRWQPIVRTSVKFPLSSSIYHHVHVILRPICQLLYHVINNTNPLKPKLVLILFQYLARTSKKTQHITFKRSVCYDCLKELIAV
jgi:hypothetical protein